MKYKVGDKVRILNKCNDNGYTAHMSPYRDRVFTISEINAGWYRLKDDQGDPLLLKWRESSLEPAIFTKYDLKNGDVVKCSNGHVYIFNKDLDTLIRANGFVRLSEYKDDFRCATDETFDIVAVRRPILDFHCQFTAFERSLGDLVYERVEPEEMTLEEVCKLLGKQIKIIP